VSKGRTVEALACVGAGGQDQQRRAAGVELQAGQGRSAGLSAQPAAQHDRVVAHLLQGLGQVVEMGYAQGEGQAVTPAGHGLRYVGCDLAHAPVIGCQVAVDRRHPARRCRAAIRLADLPAARRRTVAVLGHEQSGIPPEAIELLDVAVEIPVIGIGASLKVAVAGSLVLYRFAGFL